MQKSVGYFVILLTLLFLSGCASLGEIARDIQDIDASKEISAIAALTDDITNQPWDNILQVGIGYSLALLRRWYKKKKGAK